MAAAANNSRRPGGDGGGVGGCVCVSQDFDDKLMFLCTSVKIETAQTTEAGGVHGRESQLPTATIK